MSHFARAMKLSPSTADDHEIGQVCAPAELGGANGIRLGPDGRLWVCEALAGSLSSVDITTGDIINVVPRNTLIGPDDVAFDSEGTAYITGNNGITARRPDGSLVDLVTPGALPGSNGITVDSKDRLYVDEFRPDGRVVEVDRASGAIHVIAEGLDFANACEKGPDGRLYLQEVIKGRILALDTETGELEQVADGFEQVSSVKFTPEGRLVLSEAMRGDVTEIDLETRERRVVAHMPLEGVDNIEVDMDGTLYVSSFTTGTILKVHAGGEPEILVPPGLSAMMSVAPLPDDAVVVGNTLGIARVDKHGTIGNWSAWCPSYASDFVVGVWPYDDENAYVLTAGGQVFRCRPGQVLNEIAAAAIEDPSIKVADGAVALGFSPAGVLVALAGGAIERFETHHATRRIADTGVAGISSVAEADGVLAVASPDSQVVALVQDGVIATITGFRRPTGVAIIDGALYVADHGARTVTRRDLGTGDQVVVAYDLPFGAPVADPPPVGIASLAALPDGGLLVGCDGDGSIRKLVRH